MRLNLHLPDEPARDGRPLPVVVWFIGGGWLSCEYRWAPIELLPEGFAVVSVEYRITPEFVAPDNVHDCKAAVRWARANASQYNLSPDRIGVMGSSAGAHLALLLAMTPDHALLEGDGGNPEFSSNVQAVVGYCGPTDLTRVGNPDFPHYNILIPPVYAYLGGSPVERSEMATLMSPITHVSSRCPPVLTFHGDQDINVPLEESLNLHKALSAAGAADHEHVTVPGEGHSINAPTLDTVAAFFRRTLTV
jgi:acetyl esterase/lipase